MKAVIGADQFVAPGEQTGIALLQLRDAAVGAEDGGIERFFTDSEDIANVGQCPFDQLLRLKFESFGMPAAATGDAWRSARI